MIMWKPGFRVPLTEIIDNAFSKFRGANKVYRGKCASGQFKILLYDIVHLCAHVRSTELKR